MYPTLYHAFLDLFGVHLEFLKLFNSFGFFVVLAFIAGASALRSELNRKMGIGLIPAIQRKVTRGAEPTMYSWISNALLGALVGYKLLYLILNSSTALADPPAFLLSTMGSPIGALLGAAAFFWMRKVEFKKEKKEFPEEVQVEYTLTAKDHASNIAMTAALWGFIGAKLFFIIEDPNHIISFFTDFSVDSILSGLTLVGGLILGGAAVLWYFKKNGIPVYAGADAAAPGFILAYGVGRLGCQVSGDGDWGIANANPKPGFLSWIPDWAWSYNYPNNVNGVLGVSEKGGYVAKYITPDMNLPIFDGYGTYLDPGVYPTPIYEFGMALLIFLLAMSLRKKVKHTGVIFFLMLLLNGVERFFIEKIRVNEEFDFLGIHPTQAELIAVMLVLIGAVGIFIRMRSPAVQQT